MYHCSPMDLFTVNPNDGEFHSPTHGAMSFDKMFDRIVEYMEDESTMKYNIIIGADSFLAKDTLFVVAVVIHRVGHGGTYFYRKMRRRKIASMRQRIIYEASLSIDLASHVERRLSENGYKHLPVEIHLDIGTNGETREIIKEVVGMVTGSGYAAVTKPDSYGATKVADRHSK